MDSIGQQASFIPKQSLSAASGRGGGFGLIFLLGVLIFVMSILAAGGVLAYQGYLGSQVKSMDEKLRVAEGAFNASSIQDLIRLDKRMLNADILLQKHVNPSAIFFFLSTITLERVQLGGMEYTLQPDGGASISLSGVADSFSSVALQSDEFGLSKMLRDVIFSGITVDEKGQVSFSVNATLDPQLISYVQQIRNTSAESSPTTPATVTQ
jgi:hypothetical protein